MRKKFLREPGNLGLVNLENYLPYLEPDPSKVPILLPTDYNSHLPEDHRYKFVYQHIYFPEARYRQEGIHPSEKKWGLNWMRRISYNQVIMHRRREIDLHRDHEGAVVPPEDRILYDNLEDLAHIDIIGAAIMGRIVATYPEVHAIYLSHAGSPARPELTPTEKVEYFDDLFEKSLGILDNPIVTPERVITSGLKRMAVYLGHKELESEADARIKRDGIYYPLRVPKLERLYHLSNHLLLRAEDDPINIVQPRELVLAKALQREVKVVPLAA